MDYKSTPKNSNETKHTDKMIIVIEVARLIIQEKQSMRHQKSLAFLVYFPVLCKKNSNIIRIH